MKQYDAVVVGSGPNGLAAAITLAQKQLKVLLVEASRTVGGGMRSDTVTLPGFLHDSCSTIHPLGIASPFFTSLPLDKSHLKWIHPPLPLAHPFLDGSSVILDRSIDMTAAYLNRDKVNYIRLMEPFVRNYKPLLADVLAPLHWPRSPLVMSRFGYYGIHSAKQLVDTLFRQQKARALFAGLSAHAILPLSKLCTAAFGIIIGAAGHAVGWPIIEGGTQSLAHVLASYFCSLGGDILTHTPISSIEDLPKSRALLLDVTPKQFLTLFQKELPLRYKNRLHTYRYGPGVFKMDWALNCPIPWTVQECKRAGTIHLGGTFEEIAASEACIWQGEMPSTHFIIVTQPSLFDATRAPPDQHTAWAYCHVPNGSTWDLTQQIELQIEQYAPGFRDCIIGRHTRSPAEFERYNSNYVGGDINGGVADIYQLFTRPLVQWNPYATPLKGVYMCSASTPPGGGVHGMCGYYAAQSALKDIFSY